MAATCAAPHPPVHISIPQIETLISFHWDHKKRQRFQSLIQRLNLAQLTVLLVALKTTMVLSGTFSYLVKILLSKFPNPKSKLSPSKATLKRRPTPSHHTRIKKQQYKPASERERLPFRFLIKISVDNNTKHIENKPL
ncbi:hypothetical protein ACOSP7_015456 [Xanthoceras sorbifolium]